MTFSATSLLAVLQAHTPVGATGLVVAVSGGADSTCLLSALTQPGLRAFRHLPVRAVHVDHGLQPAAPRFRRACEELCRGLGISLRIETVAVESGDGGSIEAAAREARYLGLARGFSAGECLLTAHHADDQAETLLLQLLRGSGLKGVSAMPLCREWHGGWHLRPLLGVTRQELRTFGVTRGISAVADPMNDDPRFDRAYLRSEVWPLIARRWPGATAALARSAGHFAEAQYLLDQSAARTLNRLRDGLTLSVPGLRSLTPAEQTNALRFWIIGQGVQVPPASRLHEAQRQLFTAESDHLPVVSWGAHALRRYRDRLFLTEAEAPRLGDDRTWPGQDAALELGRGLGSLHRAVQLGGLDAARLPATLTVARRRGGERLRPHRRGRTQTLQHLCQSIGVLPWLRDALPLVYAGRDLIAVGDLWLDARWCVPPGADGVAWEWRGGPEIV
jgi:tRNA(Ile)-lysidine synthase